jgi:hypothetical protein
MAAVTHEIHSHHCPMLFVALFLEEEFEMRCDWTVTVAVAGANDADGRVWRGKSAPP